MDELSKRNFNTLAEGLKQQREINSQQDIQIKSLQDALTQLQQQVQALQSQSAIYLAQTYGNGATVK